MPPHLIVDSNIAVQQKILACHGYWCPRPARWTQLSLMFDQLECISLCHILHISIRGLLLILKHKGSRHSKESNTLPFLFFFFFFLLGICFNGPKSAKILWNKINRENTCESKNTSPQNLKISSPFLQLTDVLSGEVFFTQILSTSNFFLSPSLSYYFIAVFPTVDDSAPLWGLICGKGSLGVFISFVWGEHTQRCAFTHIFFQIFKIF